MSVPFYGKQFAFTQPDGSQLQVRGWGDQHHAVFETMDGFTIVQDPVTGFFQYADLSSDHEELRPTGLRPGVADPRAVGVPAGVRITRASARARSAESQGLPRGRSRWETRREEARMLANGMIGVPAPAGKNEFFVHARSAKEYFIVENRYKAGRDTALTDSGLAIWRVDEVGDNSNEQMTSASHYECSLMQGDGSCDLEHGVNDGDNRDLFHAGANTRFADATTPNSKWWDGTPSSLEIFDISAAGPVVSFSARV